MAHEVNIQTLYDLLESKEQVDPYQLSNALQGIYRNIKIVGIGRTTVQYTTFTGQHVERIANELSERTRAIALLGASLLIRFSYEDTRMQKHYNLSVPVKELIETDVIGTKIFGAEMPIINMCDFIEAFTSLELSYHHSF